MNQNNNTTTLTLLLLSITYYDIIVLHVLCFKKTRDHVFIARQHTDIDIANLSVCLSVRLSVRDVAVSDENGLTYRHSFFTVR